MIVVLIGEAGEAALHKIGHATEIHAVGFVPDTRRPVAVHKDGEEAVAQRVKPDLVVGGTPSVWGVEEPVAQPEEMIVEQAPKKRGRPRKVL